MGQRRQPIVFALYQTPEHLQDGLSRHRPTGKCACKHDTCLWVVLSAGAGERHRPFRKIPCCDRSGLYYSHFSMAFVALDTLEGGLDGGERSFEHLGKAALAEQQTPAHPVTAVILTRNSQDAVYTDSNFTRIADDAVATTIQHAVKLGYDVRLPGWKTGRSQAGQWPAARRVVYRLQTARSCLRFGRPEWAG